MGRLAATGSAPRSVSSAFLRSSPNPSRSSTRSVSNWRRTPLRSSRITSATKVWWTDKRMLRTPGSRTRSCAASPWIRTIADSRSAAFFRTARRLDSRIAVLSLPMSSPICALTRSVAVRISVSMPPMSPPASRRLSRFCRAIAWRSSVSCRSVTISHAPRVRRANPASARGNRNSDRRSGAPSGVDAPPSPPTTSGGRAISARWPIGTHQLDGRPIPFTVTIGRNTGKAATASPSASACPSGLCQCAGAATANVLVRDKR